MLVSIEHEALGELGWLTSRAHERGYRALSTQQRIALELWTRSLMQVFLMVLTVPALIADDGARTAYQEEVRKISLRLGRVAASAVDKHAAHSWTFDPNVLFKAPRSVS